MYDFSTFIRQKQSYRDRNLISRRKITFDFLNTNIYRIYLNKTDNEWQNIIFKF